MSLELPPRLVAEVRIKLNRLFDSQVRRFLSALHVRGETMVVLRKEWLLR